MLSFIKRKLIYLAVIFCMQANAQSQWGNLRPGPFPIGYKTLPFIDNSRRYFDAGRPLQVYLWYPATPFDEKEAMAYGGYFDDIGQDWGAADSDKLSDDLRRQFKSSALNPSFPGAINDEQFDQILGTRTPVKRNASHAAGRFPVILHIHSNGALTQSVMLEYLASHGYIVMSISMYGSSPAYYGRGEGTASELLDLTQDLAFVLGEAQKMPNVDKGNTAVVGMLSQIGLTLQSKTRAVKAIACLDCFWNPALIEKIPYYDRVALTMPILEVVNTEFASRTNTFVDSLQYSERYIVRFKKLPHADFYPFPRIAKPAEAIKNVNYDLLMILTVNFLDAVLKNKMEAIEYISALADAGKRPSDIASFRKELPKAARPTEHEFLTWLRYGNIADAKAAWKQHGKALASESNLFFATLFLAKDQEAHAFDVYEMYISAFPGSDRNSMLYEHLAYPLMRSQPHDAFNVCEKWVNQFPDSPHGYRALAEACIVLGRKKDALENMKMSLRKASELDIASDKLEQLMADLRKRLKEMEVTEGIDPR